MVARLTDGEILVNEAWRLGLKPDPELTIDKWADKYRMLSSEGGAEPGKWRTARTPYLREIMECLSPCHPCLRVVFMKGAQIGATEAMNNWIGYVIHMAPGPFLMVQPSLDLAKKVSKQRIATAINETDVLRERISPPRERDSGNTLMMKEFTGGVLMLTGANSAAGLRSMPIRYLSLDEVDAYPQDVDGEGDPIKIAEKRTNTFARKKVFIASTPTIKGLSRVEREFFKSDQRYYNVPCPHCGEYQPLKWRNIKFQHDNYELISDVTYLCEFCGCLIEERFKTQMLREGKWVAENPEGAYPGFHLSALYSPLGWSSWADITKEFLEFKKLRSYLLQKTWTNTVLGETWEETGKEVSWNSLFSRREDFPEKFIREDIVLITAGVDTQDDRIEITIVGWAADEESYALDHFVIYGDLTLPVIWKNLDKILLRTYLHERGTMRISCVAVDTGGHHTNEVYEYTKPRESRKVFAIKGASVAGLPISGKPSRQKSGVYLFGIGVDTAKDLLFNRLTIAEHGPGFIHFPKKFNQEYFEQLTAEKAVNKQHKGSIRREWIKTRPRNEALDCMVYAIAALNIFAFMVYPTLTIGKMLGEIGTIIKGMERTQHKAPEKPAPAKKRSRIISPGLTMDDI